MSKVVESFRLLNSEIGNDQETEEIKMKMVLVFSSP